MLIDFNQIWEENIKHTLRARYAAEYKPKTGTFSVYDRETKERVNVKALELLTISKLMRYERSMDFTSEIFADLRNHVIDLRKLPGMNYIGSFKYDFERKCLVDLDGVPSQFKGLTTMVLFGLTRKGETMEISISGATKRDLEIIAKDGSNKEKMKNLAESDWIRIQPSEAITRVQSSGGASANIHLLDILPVDRSVEEYSDRAQASINALTTYMHDKKLSIIEAKRNRGWNVAKITNSVQDEFDEYDQGPVPEYDNATFSKSIDDQGPIPPSYEMKPESEFSNEDMRRKWVDAKNKAKFDEIPF